MTPAKIKSCSTIESSKRNSCFSSSPTSSSSKAFSKDSFLCTNSSVDIDSRRSVTSATLASVIAREEIGRSAIERANVENSIFISNVSSKVKLCIKVYLKTIIFPRMCKK